MRPPLNKAIVGRGGGKSGGGGGYEAPNDLRAISTARVIDILSEGPIGGLVDKYKSVFFDDTPFQHGDDSFSVEGVTIWGRTGLPDQPHVDGFNEIEREIAVGVGVTKDNPEGSGSGDGSVTRQITDSTVDAVRVKVRLPAGLTWVKDSGEILRSYVDVAIDVMPNGGVWAEKVADRIQGKTTSPYERAYRISLPAGGNPWQVRVRRVTNDRTSVKEVDSISFGSYTELIEAKLTYPDTAFAALSVDADAFGGSVPVRTYEMYGLLIDVPSNYNPQTRVYTGIWDGTFQTAWTDNPAWVLYALLTNRRWGLGDFIAAAQVDKWAFYSVAQYCDGLVDDGFGGTEPRFTFNGAVEGREDAIRAVQLVAGSFRCMTHWASGAVTISQDRPSDPVKLVTPANVIEGEFVYSGTGLKSRPTVALVSWHDPDEGYKPAIEVVEDPALINEYGWRQADIRAIGCTSRGQAYRTGKWALDTAWNQTETVTYRASWDHADVAPGDIVAIADPAYAGARLGGRIVTPGTTSIVIDAPVTIDGLQSYTLSVAMPDGSLESRTLTSGAGDHTTLTWTTALAEAPVPGAIWIVAPVEPRQFRIIGVVEAEPNIFEITALQHDPNKYARIEEGVVLDSPSFSILPSGPIPPPINPTHSEYFYKPATTVLSAVEFSWEAPNDARVTLFEVQSKAPDTDGGGAGRVWKPERVTSDLSVQILSTDDGQWSFRVRALDNLDRKSPWLEYTATLSAGDIIPSDVEDFSITVNGAASTLAWKPVPDLNLSDYRIKHSPRTDGPEWGEATLLADNLIVNTLNGAANSGTFLIKAVSLPTANYPNGRESVNAAAIRSTIGAVEGLNVVAIENENPTFPGAKTNVVVDGTTLRLAEETPGAYFATGTYAFQNPIDLGAVFTSRVSASITAGGGSLGNTIDDWITIDSIDSIDGTAVSDWNVAVQIRYTSDDPASSPVWTDWTDLIIGDYTARAFEARAILTGANTNISPVIDNLSLVIDMPDRIVAQNNLVVPIGGLRIDFTPPFNVTPAIGTTATAVRVAKTAEDETGFNIELFDKDDNSVVGEIDYLAKGYGYKG